MNAKRSKKPLISIVIPVLNEELNIDRTFGAVCQILDTVQENYDYELIFTDNSSTDTSFELLTKLHQKHPDKVRVFRFSKNFGYQASILTGYRKAEGDVVIQLDCDLQDPPKMILDFIVLWEQGYDVVYGVRVKRKESFLIESARKSFYRIINLLSEEPLPVDAGDFRLISRKVLQVLTHINDAQPYLRGAIATMGFKQIGVEYVRDDRTHGESNFSLFSLTQLAIDGILNHSVLPLRLSALLGFIIFPLSLLIATIYFFVKLFYQGEIPSGFTTLVILLLGSLGINALFLGIIGEYLGRIYKQVKHKPLTIIEQSLDTKSKQKKNDNSVEIQEP